jgi:hypothetical protein
MFDDCLVKADVLKQSQTDWNQLIESHTSATIRAERIEEQIEDVMKSLVIPESWYSLIAAYYLNNDGMADFERESYNLRRELERLQNLYTDGFISKAKFQEQAMTITSEIKKLEVMEQPEVKMILPYLTDFSKTWTLMTDYEKRSLLRIVFEAIYFDDKATVRRISAHEPFDHLLGVNRFNLN